MRQIIAASLGEVKMWFVHRLRKFKVWGEASKASATAGTGPWIRARFKACY